MHETKITGTYEIKLNAVAPDIAATAADAAMIEGYGSVFNIVDNVNDVIVPGAFAKSLEKWQAQGAWPPLLWQHDAKETIGTWRDMREDEKGLFVRGELFVDDIPRAREARKLLQEQVVTGLSIGYRTIQSHTDEKTGARILTEVDLIEISLVTFPANTEARALIASPEAGEDLSAASDDMKAFYQSLCRAVHERECELGLKFDPGQPRAPRGTADGGQWVDSGVTGRTRHTPAGTLPKPAPAKPSLKPSPILLPQRRPLAARGVSNPYPDAIRPVYPVETALAVLSGAEIGAVAARVAARAAGRVTQYIGARIADYQSEARIARAAKAIEEHLGDHAPVIRNKYGDHVFMNKAGDKKVRFDINKITVDKNGNPIKPHFQIEKKIISADGRNEEWIDAGSKHHYHFNGTEK